MGFSVTGNLLPGSVQRPDILTLVNVNINLTHSEAKIHRLNKLGFIPGVSTITGLGRALLGIVHTIVHLVCAIFSKNRGHHLQEVSLGAKNILRGAVEAIPVIGNTTMLIADDVRSRKFSNMADNQMKANISNYMNLTTVFANGQEVTSNALFGVLLNF